MPTYEITAPDGKVYEVTAPQGASESEVLDYAKRNFSMAAKPEKPAVVQAGEFLRAVPRQVGLTARYGLEGLGNAASIFTEPVRGVASLLGQGDKFPTSTGQQASMLADAIGLPKPEGATERVVGDVARTMAGAGGTASAANLAAKGATGVTQGVLQSLGANPAQQLVSAAGAGGAGGAVREAGGGPIEQAVAALVGGVATPIATDKAVQAGKAVMSMFKGNPPMQKVDLAIELALSRNGVDWKQVPTDVKAQLRTEVADALKTGQPLKSDAIARLADFKMVGATPTRGTVTLDPVQLTREKNLAKTGANSTDVGMQSLARVENANNQALIDSLNRQGASTAQDARGAAQTVIGTLEGRLRSDKASVDSLYSAARDSQGRSFPLDGAAFTNAAAKALDDNLLGGALPSSVRDHLNRIARGEVPFTVDYAEQLKTAIGKLQRATSDGQTRMALGVVRQQLDNTPVQGLGPSGPIGAARPVNPGNLPAIPNSSLLGEDAVAAFNAARKANAQMMQRIEEVPALKAVYEGVEPDQFVSKFITGQTATVKSVQGLRASVEGSQDAIDAIRGQIAAHLKSKALNGAADEVGNFSASGYDKALQAIGKDKLAAFFSSEEIQQMEAIARVARYTQVQPKGSAVNNSNSGALLLGRGLDFLDAVAGRLPVGQDTVRGFVRGFQQQGALNTTPGLLQAPAPTSRGLLAPAATGTSLLLPTAVPGRENDRRK